MGELTTTSDVTDSDLPRNLALGVSFGALLVLMVGACGLMFVRRRRTGETPRATLRRLRTGETPGSAVDLKEGAVDLDSEGPQVDQIARKAAAEKVLADARAAVAGPRQPDKDTPPDKVVIDVEPEDLVFKV